MKKWTVILVLLVLLGVAVFINFDRIALLIPTDFSETEMVFESDGSTRYYYDTLSDDGKVAYTKILSEIRTHPEKIEIPNLSDSEYDEMFYALSYDNPELLCMKNESQLQRQGAKTYFLPRIYVNSNVKKWKQALKTYLQAYRPV